MRLSQELPVQGSARFTYKDIQHKGPKRDLRDPERFTPPLTMADTHQTRSETTASQPKEEKKTLPETTASQPKEKEEKKTLPETTALQPKEKKTFPNSEDALLIRTDFSNQATWDTIVESIRAPTPGGFSAYVDIIDDPAYRDLTLPELLTLAPPYSECFHAFVFVVDGVAVLHPEHAVLVVDVSPEEGGLGRTFRAVPRAVQAIENNLSVATMNFEDFAENVDADGVFRGFRPPEVVLVSSASPKP